MHINKNTIIYGSISNNPGNWGCEFHNAGFEALNINAIYKSFKINNITELQNLLGLAYTLGIRGLGVSSPFKKIAAQYCTRLMGEAKAIGNVNTLIFGENGSIKGYNTDIVAVRKMLKYKSFSRDKSYYIIGDGAYADTWKYGFNKVYWINNITSNDLDKLETGIVINCTPVILKGNNDCEIINASIETDTGKILARYQAMEQFRLYTNEEYPL